jgi:hypothetical protein
MRLMGVLVGVLAFAVVMMGQSAAVAANYSGAQDMFCNMGNAEFYKYCQDQQFMKGLTPEQKQEIDREWQKRVPTLTPEEKNLYYPLGRRYYQGQ